MFTFKEVTSLFKGSAVVPISPLSMHLTSLSMSSSHVHVL